MKLRFFQVLIVLLVLSSAACKRAVVVEEIITLPESVWNRFNILEYTLSVTDLRSEYDLIVLVNVSDDRIPERFPIHFILTSPSGETRIWEHTFLFRNPDNSIRGTQRQGAYEFEFVVRNNMKFNERGSHQLSLEQFHPTYNTHGISSVGVRVVRN